MAYEILSKEYRPTKPLLSIQADSLDELPTEGVAEGSTASVGGTQYVFENNSGWVTPGSGGGGGGGGGVTFVGVDIDESGLVITLNKTYKEITTAAMSSVVILPLGEHILYLSTAVIDAGSYDVGFFCSVGQEMKFSATSEDGYPSVSVTDLMQG